MISNWQATYLGLVQSFKKKNLEEYTEGLPIEYANGEELGRKTNVR